MRRPAVRPDLMPQRLRVAAQELRPATSAFARLYLLHVVALVGGNQRSLVFLVARLTAAFPLGLLFSRPRSGMGMLAAGRQRGVLRRFSLHPPLQLLDPRPQLGILRLQGGNFRQQRTDDGPCFRRLSSNDFFGNFQRHANGVAENGLRVQINLSIFCPQGVNGYCD